VECSAEALSPARYLRCRSRAKSRASAGSPWRRGNRSVTAFQQLVLRRMSRSTRYFEGVLRSETALQPTMMVLCGFALPVRGICIRSDTTLQNPRVAALAGGGVTTPVLCVHVRLAWNLRGLFASGGCCTPGRFSYAVMLLRLYEWTFHA
jgi:hypothetical protein